MELLKFAEVREDPRTGAKLDSTLDLIMKDLEKKVQIIKQYSIITNP